MCVITFFSISRHASSRSGPAPRCTLRPDRACATADVDAQQDTSRTEEEKTPPDLQASGAPKKEEQVVAEWQAEWGMNASAANGLLHAAGRMLLSSAYLQANLAASSSTTTAPKAAYCANAVASGAAAANLSALPADMANNASGSSALCLARAVWLVYSIAAPSKLALTKASWEAVWNSMMTSGAKASCIACLLSPHASPEISRHL